MASDSSAHAARLNAIYTSTAAANAQAQNEAQFRQSFDEAVRQNKRSEYLSNRQWEYGNTMARRQWQRSLIEAERDRRMQREFAQNGVQWRAADARAAGIHPLAALGMQGVSSSPVQVGTTSNPSNVQYGQGNVPTANAPIYSTAAPFTGSEAVGTALGSFGQDISRAITAAQTDSERNRDLERASSTLALENQQLQNQLLAAQIAKTRGASVGPGAPSPSSRRFIAGQGNTPGHDNPTIVPERQWSRGPRNSFSLNPSKEVKELIEDDAISQVTWNARNRLTMMTDPHWPPVKLPKGMEWYWDPATQTANMRKKTWLKNILNGIPKGVQTIRVKPSGYFDPGL